MPYFDGLVAAVPRANQQAYIDHATKMAGHLKAAGATRVTENWGDDLLDGKVTDFKRAVAATADETVVFSWIEWPSKNIRDAGWATLTADPALARLALPFDGTRLIYGGFTPLVDTAGGGEMGYVDGYLLPVTPANRDAYTAMAQMAAPVFLEHGATRVVEAWGDDVPEGKTTDFYRAVAREGDENIVFSWVEWPSKEARTKGAEKVMADPRMQPDAIAEMPFNGQRMIYSGFAPMLDL